MLLIGKYKATPSTWRHVLFQMNQDAFGDPIRNDSSLTWLSERDYEGYGFPWLAVEQFITDLETSIVFAGWMQRLGNRELLHDAEFVQWLRTTARSVVEEGRKRKWNNLSNSSE